MHRRKFLKTSAIAAAGLFSGSGYSYSAEQVSQRLNILWITCEDMSPHLGCYGDKDVPLPPYYPDTPIVRTDLAKHYDNIAILDKHGAESIGMATNE